MDDAVKKYRERRDARVKKRMDEEWVTIKGNHVMIDDDGQVSKGPEKLKSIVKESGGYKPVKKIPSMESMGKYVKEYEKMGVPMEKAMETLYKHGSDTKKAIEELKANFGKETKASTMEGDFEKEGYKKNAEGRWEKEKDTPKSLWHEPLKEIDLNEIDEADWKKEEDSRGRESYKFTIKSSKVLGAKVTKMSYGEWSVMVYEPFSSGMLGRTFNKLENAKQAAKEKFREEAMRFNEKLKSRKST